MFEQTVSGQMALVAVGAIVGVVVGRRAASGLSLVPLAGLPWVGFGCTQWFC